MNSNARNRALAALATLLLVACGCAGTYAGSYSSRSRASVAVRGPDAAVSMSYFYDDLAPYGSWVEYGAYGWCWVPVDVTADWRPYQDGHWVLTDYGWTWMSYEPWGWATCHYGRWDYDAYYGWVWVPGTVWAPAWVAWHYGDDWVGWAPLPPTADWHVSVGLRFADVDRIPAPRWCFVPRQRFSDTKIKAHVVSVARNEWLIERTRDATRFDVRDGRPVNRGVDVAFVEKGERKKIRQISLVDADSPDRRRGHKSRDRIEFYRPELRDDQIRSGPPPEKRGRELAHSGPSLERQLVRERQQLERELARGQSSLRQQHARELRVARPGDAAKVRERQSQEVRSYEQQASKERQRLEDRRRKRLASAEKGQAPAKRDKSGKNKRGDDRPRGGR